MATPLGFNDLVQALNFHMHKHELVVAKSQRLAAGGGDILENDFPGDHRGNFLWIA